MLVSGSGFSGHPIDELPFLDDADFVLQAYGKSALVAEVVVEGFGEVLARLAGCVWSQVQVRVIVPGLMR